MSESPQDQPQRLKQLSDTRWSCRVESLKVIDKQYEAIVRTLEIIEDKATDSKITADARGLIVQLSTFDFILCLNVLKDFLSYTYYASQYLQSENIDLLAAVSCIQTTQKKLKEKRSSDEFSKIYKEVQEQCQKLGVNEPEMRRRRVSQ